MELLFTATAPGGARRDLQVVVDDGAATGDLADAIADVLSWQRRPAALACERLGGAVPPSLRVGSAGLLDGDVVSVRDQVADDADRIIESHRRDGDLAGYLVVRHGRGLGRWYELRRGVVVVGRSANADIVLDDPTVSRQHLELTVDAIVEGRSLSTSNAVYVDDDLLTGSRVIEPASVIRLGTVEVVFVRANTGWDGVGAGAIGFNRPPRLTSAAGHQVIELPEAPGKSRRPRIPYISALLPLLASVALALVLRSPTFLFFAFLSPVFIAASYLEDRVFGRSERRQALKEWRYTVHRTVADLEARVREEEATRRRRAPDRNAIERAVTVRTPMLWERTPGDDDFLALRLGVASLPSAIEVRIPPIADAALAAEVAPLPAALGTAHDVPLAVPLGDGGVLGLAGPSGVTTALARSLVVQAAALHSPAELTIAALVDANSLRDWSWMAWLPHCRRSPALAGSWPLASSESAAAAVIDAARQLVAEWRDERGRRPSHRLLLLVDERVPAPRSEMAALLGSLPGTGVSAVWVGSSRARLPGACTWVGEVAPDGSAVTLSSVLAGATSPPATVEGIGTDRAEAMARRLAPLRDVSERVRQDATLPAALPVAAILGGPEALDDPDVIRQRWRSGRPLHVTVGATGSGPLTLDIRLDGPHALVAGTTGAGKSEFLQSLIVSMAASMSPEQVTFLLVDYKGGAAFRECAELPHVVGFVTDLGGNLARRALISLNAEIRRREEILEHVRAKDLPEMERRQHPDTPPNLLLVCDEFAALAKEIPEFVEGVVDVAQRGRSLGVHMVLATQRPTGVVTPTIQANATLRVALRVAPGESADVIGTTDAEQIERSTPGRAFVRIGTRQPVQFQAAYVGGFTSGAGNDASVDLSWLEFEGLRPVVGTGGESAPEHAATDLERTDLQRTDLQRTDLQRTDLQRTDLQRLVSTIGGAADRAGLPKPRSPLLDPLPPIVPLATLTVEAGPHEVVLGLLDEPSEQRQRPVVLDLDREGGLVVVGAGGAGKSGALRAIVADLSTRADPDELHVYAIDFGRSLALLESLPTVGSVIGGDDTERVSRLFRMLRDTIDRRGERFAAVSATTLTEYRRLRPADGDAARILVMLDGWSGFNDTYNRAGFHHLEDGFPRLITDGRAAGVSFVLTTDRLTTIPSAIRGVIPRLVALRQVNLDEYDALGVRATKADLELPPGRGYYGGLEIQVPLVGDDPTGEGQAAAVTTLGETLVERAGGRRAPVVGRLPTAIDAADLPPPPGPLVPVFGIDDADFAPASFDLAAFNLAVTGPLQSGRTTALAAMIASLAPHHDDLGLYLIAGRRRELIGAAPWRGVAVGADDALGLVNGLIDALDGAGLSGHGTLIVVDDMQELDDKPVDERLSTLLRRGRDDMVRAVVAAEIATFRRPSFDGTIKALRAEGAVLFLQPGDDDGGLVDQVLPLGRRRFDAGRGFLVRRNTTPMLVQVAQPTAG